MNDKVIYVIVISIVTFFISLKGYRDDIITHNLEDVVAYTYQRNWKEKRFLTPRDAYASLIDAIKGKGTWESNPLVYVYEFELID